MALPYFALHEFRGREKLGGSMGDYSRDDLMRSFLTLVAVCLLFATVGCSKPQTVELPKDPPLANTPGAGQGTTNAIDACSLLKSNEIEAIQGAPLKDTKPSSNSHGGVTVSQCDFLLPTAAESIVLTVTQRAKGADARDPKDLWKETFHREKERSEPDRKGESKFPPPQEIADVGDEAFWAPLGTGGSLYALKGNIQIRVSVGGPGDQEAKIQKSKALAEAVLKRL